MATLGEILRWIVYTVSTRYSRIAARVLRRDRLLVGSERKFRALIESAPDAIVIVDWHGHITLVNQEAERVFGYSAEELRRQNITVLIPERFREQHRVDQRDYLSAPEPRTLGKREAELYGRRKDGSEFPAEISLGPLATEQGLLVSAVIRDITDRRVLEAELTRRADALERSNAELEHFAAVASHDLQAPLNTVAGLVQVLGRRYAGKLDEEADRIIDLSVDGVKRMQALIDDLLAFSRVSQSPELRRETIDTRATIDEVLTLYRDQIGERHVDVQVGELPDIVGAERQIEQLFQNLIGNAIKFSRADAPLVEVSAEPDGEVGRWWFRVRDNGIGIAPEDREAIFEMFKRLHGHEEFAGTGIGLAICQRIVENHGGQIHAEEAPGGGTIMAFTLPVTERTAHP